MTKAEKILEIQVLQEKERLYCAGDFGRWVSGHAYIEDKERKAPMRFKLWDSQQRILPKLLDSQRLAILKARQLGLTWICAAYTLWYALYKPMKQCVVISAKGDWAVEFLDRVYFMLQRLPEYLLAGLKVEKQTSEVFRVRHHDGTSSEIKSLTTTEAGAQSKTPDVLVLDETCWNPYIKQIYNASKPGIDAAGGRIIIISNSIKTAPGWGWTRDLFTGAMRGDVDFDHIFMSWTDRPGRPADFRERMIREGMDEEEVVEHYPESLEEAISALTGSYFGRSLTRHTHTLDGVLGELRASGGDLEFVESDRGILTIWRWPYDQVEGWDGLPWTRRYCIGSDVSEGLGQSYSVCYVYDRLLHDFVARLRSNRVDAHRWADMLYDLSAFYRYGRPAGEWYEAEYALICVETTGAGQTTVRRLEERRDANLYMQLAAPKAGSELTMRYGWHESNQAKHDLSEDLRNWMRTTDGSVYDQTLIDECSTWIRHENGRIGPEDDTKYGDCVVAAGLAIQADYFMDGRPEQIPAPDVGWLKRLKEEARGNVWAR